MHSEYDVTDCLWCQGDGTDHGTLGMAQVRECPRCAGSGKVHLTSRESTTGRRRVYKGPAPKPGVTAAHQQIFAPAKSAFPPSLAVTTELTETLRKPKRPHTHKKDARSHAA